MPQPDMAASGGGNTIAQSTQPFDFSISKDDLDHQAAEAEAQRQANAEERANLEQEKMQLRTEMEANQQYATRIQQLQQAVEAERERLAEQKSSLDAIIIRLNTEQTAELNKQYEEKMNAVQNLSRMHKLNQKKLDEHNTIMQNQAAELQMRESNLVLREETHKRAVNMLRGKEEAFENQKAVFQGEYEQKKAELKSKEEAVEHQAQTIAQEKQLLDQKSKYLKDRESQLTEETFSGPHGKLIKKKRRAATVDMAAEAAAKQAQARRAMAANSHSAEVVEAATTNLSDSDVEAI